MNPRLIFAILAALGTGLAIALQATFNGRAGIVVGPIRTGLLVNAAGGTIAAIVLVAAILSGRFGVDPPTVLHRSVFPYVVAAGLLGIVIIVGVTFSVSNIGVTAGLAAVILSQLVVGLLIDQGAIGGGIAIDLRRIAGTIAMAAGVWLLIPRAS